MTPENYGFGFVDKNKFDGDLTTVKVDAQLASPLSWTAHGVSYIVGGKNIATVDGVMFDTGWIRSSAPLAVVRQYHAGIKGAVDVNGDGRTWRVPCTTNPPDLTLHFPITNGMPSGKIAELVIPGWIFVEQEQNSKDGRKSSLPSS